MTTKTKEVNPEGKVLLSEIDDQVFAFDAGYSTMKFRGKTKIDGEGKILNESFPSYVTPYVDSFGESSEPMENIIYKDETGWYFVGQNALNRFTQTPELYKPQEKMDRYYFRSHKYLIAVRVAMALAYPDKTKHAIPLVVTGLPSDFVDTDSPELESILKKDHEFQLTFNGETKSYQIKIADAITVPQPYGTLGAFAYNRMGELVRPDILNNYTRIHDWGFKTTDEQLTLNGVTVPEKCFSLVGIDETMSQCYTKIAEEIRKLTGKVIPNISIRQYLKQGKYTTRGANLKMQVVELQEIADPIFEKAVEVVVTQAIQNDGSLEVKHNILTGGGAGERAILEAYKSYYEDLLYPQQLGIEPAFANVEGYKNLGVNARLAMLQQQ